LVLNSVETIFCLMGMAMHGVLGDFELNSSVLVSGRLASARSIGAAPYQI